MPNINNAATVDFYDSHASAYFNSTVGVEMAECCERFLKYLSPGDNIIDVGAGSGRDIRYFLNRGYVVEGIDASSELCKLASEYTGVDVQCQTIQDWNPTGSYKGVWANASLLHLSIEEIQNFINKMPDILRDGGVAYFSFKSGIVTGTGLDGRFFTNVTEQEVQQIIKKSTAISIVDMWKTEDKLNRDGFYWINVIVQKT